MTPRAKYIAHCESLGIHKSLAGLMADVPGCKYDARSSFAHAQLYSFVWPRSEQGSNFWWGVRRMIIEMAKTGECE